MNVSKTLIRLSVLIATLALSSAAAGLFWQDGGSTFPFTTLHGQTVQIYGQGLYRYDSVLIATGYRVADAFTLGVAIPLLVLAVLLYRRGWLRGGLLLTGTLAYFTYNFGSLAFGAAYNNLFLVYIALVAASFLALVVALTSFGIQALPARFSAQLPRHGISVFLSVSGAVLAAAWLGMSTLPRLLGAFIVNNFSAGSQAQTDEMNMRSSVGMALLVSEHNDKRVWVETGRVHERLALTATALGIKSAFMNQPVEVPALRSQLQSHLVLESAYPQLLMRFGYSQTMPRSLRRPVADVMV